MKRIMFLVTIVLLGTAGLFAQQKSEVPFRNCNTIQILKHGPSDSLLVQFARFLKEEGYGIDRINKKNTNLRTTPFNLISHKLNNAIIHVMAPADKSKHMIIVTAFTKPHEYGASPYKMRAHSSKMAENGTLFSEVDYLAKKFANTYRCDILYVKSKH
ncbi:MAG: hypothetical protein GXO86_14390 [Chlorobi bacterium]|nr:hypothetical protein [Chlorobiota bacterium]